MSSDGYLHLIEQRLRDDGARVETMTLGGEPALVGYRSTFKLRWMATRLHLFTVVVARPAVDAPALEAFSRRVLQYAVAEKGSARGGQVGVATIPVIVADQVAPNAVALAEKRLIRKFAAFAWPAVVDLSTGDRFSHQRRVILGGIYASWMRQRASVALPEVPHRPGPGLTEG